MKLIPMKILTLRQPWAWLIFHAGKDVENRTWGTAFRGRIGIHTSARMEAMDYRDAEYVLMDVQRSRANCPDLPARESRELVLGFIIGTVEITGCVRKGDSPWHMDGQFGFLLRNPILLPEPIPCKGKLSFWDYELQDPWGAKA